MVETFDQVKHQTAMAAKAASTSEMASQTAATALRLDQRAWIIVKYPTISLNDGMPIAVPLIMD
jgi:hypothetical protein